MKKGKKYLVCLLLNVLLLTIIDIVLILFNVDFISEFSFWEGVFIKVIILAVIQLVSHVLRIDCLCYFDKKKS